MSAIPEQAPTDAMTCIGCGQVFACTDDVQSVYHEAACQEVYPPENQVEAAKRLRRYAALEQAVSPPFSAISQLVGMHDGLRIAIRNGFKVEVSEAETRAADALRMWLRARQGGGLFGKPLAESEEMGRLSEEIGDLKLGEPPSATPERTLPERIRAVEYENCSGQAAGRTVRYWRPGTQSDGVEYVRADLINAGPDGSYGWLCGDCEQLRKERAALEQAVMEAKREAREARQSEARWFAVAESLRARQGAQDE